VACENKEKLEQLVDGSLSEEESANLLAHLRDCRQCRRELAFINAVRSALPASTPGDDCPSDETLVMLVDDVLPAEERERALAHLSRCDHCLRSWLSLNRALAAVGEEPVTAPANLVARAKKLTGADRAKKSWLERILGPSPWLQVGLAGAAAAAVFALVVVFSSEPVPRSVRGTDMTGDMLAVPEPPASLDVTGPRLPDERRGKPGESPQPAVAHKPSTPDTDKSGAHEVAPDSRAGAAGKPGENWLAALGAEERERILEQASSRLLLGEPQLVKALDVGKKSAIEKGYLLGRIIGLAQAYSSLTGENQQRRDNLTSMLTSAARIMKYSDTAGEGKLTRFLSSLAEKVARAELDSESTMRRLEVFLLATEETLTNRDPVYAGLRLGRIYSKLDLLASALQAGKTPPAKAWPQADSVEKVKTLVEHVQDLPDGRKRAVLRGLDNIRRAQATSPVPSKAEKISEELHSIDRNVRSTR